MKQPYPKIFAKIQQILRPKNTRDAMTFLGCQQEVVLYFISCNTAIHLLYKFYIRHLGTSSRCKKELRIRSAGILGRWSCGNQHPGDGLVGQHRRGLGSLWSRSAGLIIGTLTVGKHAYSCLIFVRVSLEFSTLEQGKRFLDWRQVNTNLPGTHASK